MEVNQKVYVRDGRFHGLRGIVFDNSEEPIIVKLENNDEIEEAMVFINSESLIPTADTFKMADDKGWIVEV